MSPHASRPSPAPRPQDTEENEWWLRREVSLIETCCAEEGELTRKEIGERLGCKYWGPPRFAHALKTGRRARGACAAGSRGRYGPSR